MADPFDADRPRPVADRWFSPLVPVAAMVLLMWVLEVLDLALDLRLDRFGIEPRRFDGLDGVALAPFLHDGLGHLLTNTLPFLVLGGAIALGNVARFVQVTLVVGLVGGLATWLAGPSGSTHIGASGLVFGYVAYLVSRGVFARKLTYLLGGLLTLMVYGSVLWGVLPRPGVSWQGHLFGAASGVLAAWLLHGERPARPMER